MISAKTALLSLLLATAGIAHAAPYLVDAKVNSSSGGAGLSTISLTAGQSFTVQVNANDLWSAGATPRWSDANGLDGDLFATGSDESGAFANTKIGQNFGLYSSGGFSAHYGSLVGKIDNGKFFKIGTSFSGQAANAGTLKLFYWDSNAGDNFGAITAQVSAVPEPSALALLAAGLAAVGLTTRRRKA